MNRIPKSYRVGGTEMEVRNVERCEGNSVGECHLCGGYIEIAEAFNKNEKQSDGSKVNTFYHELVHSILCTMGEQDLNLNERFVCSFAGFLTEAMAKAVFEDD